MNEKITENLSKVAEHWEKAAETLLSRYPPFVEGRELDVFEMTRACDETAAIVLRDCATELRQVAAGGEPTLDMSPEEKLKRALEEPTAY